MINYVIILASGVGNRFDSDKPKQFYNICGKTILEHTIEIFEKSIVINRIILVVNHTYRYLAEEILLRNNYKKIYKLLSGASSRKQSVSIGLNSIEDKEANVLIHDAVRPFLSQNIIFNCIEKLKQYKAIDVAIPSSDTLIEVNNDLIYNIPDRSRFMRGQTPQAFKLSLIKEAHRLSSDDDNFTDDCGIVLKYKLADVYVIDGEEKNIKLTYPLDM